MYDDTSTEVMSDVSEVWDLGYDIDALFDEEPENQDVEAGDEDPESEGEEEDDAVETEAKKEERESSTPEADSHAAGDVVVAGQKREGESTLDRSCSPEASSKVPRMEDNENE
jgi:hypothetical protein